MSMLASPVGAGLAGVARVRPATTSSTPSPLRSVRAAALHWDGKVGPAMRTNVPAGLAAQSAGPAHARYTPSASTSSSTPPGTIGPAPSSAAPAPARGSGAAAEANPHP